MKTHGICQYCGESFGNVAGYEQHLTIGKCKTFEQMSADPEFSRGSGGWIHSAKRVTKKRRSKRPQGAPLL